MLMGRLQHRLGGRPPSVRIASVVFLLVAFLLVLLLLFFVFLLGIERQCLHCGKVSPRKISTKRLHICEEKAAPVLSVLMGSLGFCN